MCNAFGISLLTQSKAVLRTGSSTHVGIRVKKKSTHIYLCANRHSRLRVHVCVSASTNSHFAMYFRIGGVGGLDKPEERRLLPALWWCAHPPCFSHQHQPEPRAGSAVTCEDGEGRNGNHLYECTSHFAICRVPGTAEVFQRARSPPPAWGFRPAEPGHHPRFFQPPG